MINRQNWLDMRAYLRHVERTKQRDEQTIHKYRGQMRHLLEWADSTLLSDARRIDPTLPAYLVTRRSLKQPDQTLSPVTITKTLQTVRDFFTFARTEWPRYKALSESWIEYLQPPRRASLASRLVDHQYYSLEAVRALLAVSAETLREERAQAAVAMMFLSAMRSDALASLPLKCVDLAERTIRQLPELGVRTKNHKAALTYLLDIPDLYDVVAAWDARVRGDSPDSMWYANIARDGLRLVDTPIAVVGRGHVISDDLRALCDRAGLPYLSPHKLRHGHAVFAIQQAATIADVKAISQNMMHDSVVITDALYGRYVSGDVKSRIASLGHAETGDLSKLLELLNQAKAKGLI
jgi:integrase